MIVDLVSALYNLVGNLDGLGRTSCSLQVRGTPRKLPDDWELVVYRVAQEARTTSKSMRMPARPRFWWNSLPGTFCGDYG